MLTYGHDGTQSYFSRLLTFLRLPVATGWKSLIGPIILQLSTFSLFLMPSIYCFIVYHSCDQYVVRAFGLPPSWGVIPITRYQCSWKIYLHIAISLVRLLLLCGSYLSNLALEVYLVLLLHIFQILFYLHSFEISRKQVYLLQWCILLWCNK